MSYIADIREFVGTRPLLIPGGRAIVRNNDGQVLFHRRSDLGIWDLPGGGAEIGESMAECVVREAYEETGLAILEYVPIGLSSNPDLETVEYPNGDIVQGFGLMLLATAWEGKLSVSDESTELRFIDPTQLTGLRPNIAATIDCLNRFESTGQFQLF